METINVDFSAKTGPINPMHSVNNGPISHRALTNDKYFIQARIPYARLHDSNFEADYGGPHTVDVHVIFTDFNRDPKDPEAYDFACTDKYIADILATGTKPFYRLGASIEHGVKKYGILPPKDNQKWAEICEGIIRHYTEGWANGFHYDIEYWEIWNEPDTGYKENNSPTWRGTMDEFFALFKTALIHLKSRFPHLKIGGPALCSVTDSRDIMLDMFDYLTKGERAPLDFFSWHMYGANPHEFSRKIAIVADVLKKYGYTETENILNEWNYIRDWGKMRENYNTIMSLKGAAYTASAMCVCQQAGLDHLMYYDARPCGFNGMFRDHTLEPLKGYYPFWMFNKLYELGNSVKIVNESDDVFACAAADGKQGAVMVSYFNDDDSKPDKTVKIMLKGLAETENTKVTVYSLDETNNAEPIREEYFSGDFYAPIIKMKNYTTLLIKIQAC